MSTFEDIKYQLRLKVLSDDNNIINWYKYLITHHVGDSGIDLVCCDEIKDIKLLDVVTLDFKIQAEMIDLTTNKYVSYYLVPRSSISNGVFQLTNSIGIIDSCYRGNLKAKVRCFRDNGMVEKYSSLFQIIAPDLKPISCVVVDSLSTTTRGDCGFGSTNLIDKK